MYARYVSSEVKIFQSVLTIFLIHWLVWRRLILTGMILETAVRLRTTDQIDVHALRRHRNSPVFSRMTSRPALLCCRVIS